MGLRAVKPSPLRAQAEMMPCAWPRRLQQAYDILTRLVANATTALHAAQLTVRPPSLRGSAIIARPPHFGRVNL